jgi:thioesterase domain-containing protein
MTNLSSSIVFLSGAGGGTPDFNVFREGPEDTTQFEVVSYPGWKRYASDGFSAEVLIADLAEEISIRVPQGPIRIIGHSIGGHFGYAAALRLKAMGREIAGFCAIDTFMIASSKPSAGWKGRALAQGLELLRCCRFVEFGRFLRSRLWRAVVRLAGSRLPGLLRAFSSGRLPVLSAVDPVFEEELSLRLLIEAVAPWVASLDREPVALDVPAILLRTNLTAVDDAAWRSRCPNINIFELPGQHHALFEVENVTSLREAFLAATPEWRIDVRC